MLLFSGCAIVPQADYNKKAMTLSMGISKEQVVNLMGQPKRVAARNTDNGLMEKYSWWSPVVYGLTVIDNEMLATDRVYISFLNGKVIEWGDKYDTNDIMDKQSEAIKNMSNKPVNVTIENKQPAK